MKPAPFDYIRVNTMAEAVTLCHEHGDEARILAGGQSLMAMLNMRLAQPRVLVDISQATDGGHIRVSDGRVVVGCTVRQCELERWPQLDQQLPLVARALPWIGHVQTRSRGTVCGSIAHADPSSELPLCLTLLGGDVILRSHRGERIVAASDFFAGLLTTDRRPDEVITEVRFPLLARNTGVAFNEIGARHGDFAIIAVGAIVTEDMISVAIGGAADRPVVETWSNLDGSDLDDALNALAWSLDCQDDLHATAVYRRHLIRTLGRRTIEEARACIG